MSEEENQEKTLTAFQKADDWWAKHNIGTRFALITMIALYASLVFAYLFNNDMTNIVPVMEIVGWISFAGFISITLGANGLDKIKDIILAIKMKK